MRYSSVLYHHRGILTGLLSLLWLTGCSGGGKINGGDGAQYTLEIVAEKNLDDNADYLHVRFLKDGISVTEGYVKVDGDSLSLSASGVANRTYAAGHFQHGTAISIDANDPAEAYRYQTSITMPSTMSAAVTPEADTIWQPNQGAVKVQFTLASPAKGYILTVTPRTLGTAAPGYAADATTGTLVSFSPLEAFYNQQTGDLVSDYYDVRMIAFNGTFLPRPTLPYVIPAKDYPLSVDTDELAARISAQVISGRAVIEAMELNP